MENNLPQLSVSDLVASLNQTLEYAYPSILIEGEVDSFRVNQGKFVFFNLKDEQASIGCFMMLFSLRVPIEDGMKVMVRARPKLTQWGKFSLTVESIKLQGEGSIKKGFELLRQKLDKEGLFSSERKRILPYLPRRVGVISSTEAAGYADFVKIINQRWGGMQLLVHHTSVQGEDAPDQMIRAIEYFNELSDPVEVIAIIRGGGSADDLASFNDEQLVRAIAASRTPTIVGVGHEVDTTFADMVSDVRAATPSNAAQILVPERREVIAKVDTLRGELRASALRACEEQRQYVHQQLDIARQQLLLRSDEYMRHVRSLHTVVHHYDPMIILRQGYAIIRGKPEVGGRMVVETYKYSIDVEVVGYEQRTKND